MSYNNQQFHLYLLFHFSFSGMLNSHIRKPLCITDIDLTLENSIMIIILFYIWSIIKWKAFLGQPELEINLTNQVVHAKSLGKGALVYLAYSSIVFLTKPCRKWVNTVLYKLTVLIRFLWIVFITYLLIGKSPAFLPLNALLPQLFV